MNDVQCDSASKCKLGTWEGITSTLMGVVIIVISFAWWCSSLDGRVSVNTITISQNYEQTDKRIEKLNADIQGLDKTMQVLAISQAKMDTQYVQIREALTEIKNTLDKWEPIDGKNGEAEKR